MKKTYLIIFAFFVSISATFANYSNPILNSKACLKSDTEKTIKIIGEINNKIYTLVLKADKDYFLKIFDADDMKLISQSAIVLQSESNKDIQLEDVIIVDNKLYVVETVYSHVDKTNTLIGIRMNEDGVLQPNSSITF